LRALADAEQVAGPTMSKIVAALEADGLVQRTVEPAFRGTCLLDAQRR
jgi:DNA-binding MarR family transcriptional regulator